jgi:hypothetical protein
VDGWIGASGLTLTAADLDEIKRALESTGGDRSGAATGGVTVGRAGVFLLALVVGAAESARPAYRPQAVVQRHNITLRTFDVESALVTG